MSPPTDQEQTGAISGTDNEDEDWEEWDGRDPFWIHCFAGSLAGVTEHTLVYPLDTVRTHIQVCAACLHKAKNSSPRLPKDASSLLRSALKTNAQTNKHLPVGMWQTIRYLVNEAAAVSAGTSTTAQLPALLQGWSRLWLGIQTVLIGCIPAHALYFSSYELVKAATSTRDAVTGQTHVTAVGSSLAGAAAVLSHDLIMTPLDTMKQRMQLGHYNGSVRTALRSILHQEGWMALYRSFPVTLLTNIPYGMVMVSTHEFCKQAWASPDVPTWQTVMAASSVGGCLAAAVTTPLDRIKTSLQTQQLAPACRLGKLAAAQQMHGCKFHATWKDAAFAILRDEGPLGFFRGVLPRVLSHTPAVAISWTTYETTKHYLLQRYR